MRTLTFPAHFQPEPEGGFTVTFRDVPEAITHGFSEDEACSLAADALLTSMDFYFEDGRPLPTPSAALPGERMIDCTVGDGPTFGPDQA